MDGELESSAEKEEGEPLFFTRVCKFKHYLVCARATLASAALY